MQVRQQFRPEFINRIDEFIVFQALDKLQIAQIVRLQVMQNAKPSAHVALGHHFRVPGNVSTLSETNLLKRGNRSPGECTRSDRMAGNGMA